MNLSGSCNAVNSAKERRHRSAAQRSGAQKKRSPRENNVRCAAKGDFPRVKELRHLLGEEAVLLPWPVGSKGTKRPWKHRTVHDMQDIGYLRKLEQGNIGVALGSKSNGLCSIDFDSDEWVQNFLVANPALRRTLQTRGNRGSNLWVRCTGPYPSSYRIRTIPNHESGERIDVGEWRADGNQTIISGKHPTGCDYIFVTKAPPVSIAFEEINWSDGLQPPPTQKTDLPSEHSNTAAQVHSNSATQQPSHSATQVTQVVASLGQPIFDVSAFVPTERHQSDASLWDMARHLKTWERDERRQTTANERLGLFRSWWKLAKSHVDPAVDYFVFFAKWLSAGKRVKYADDETALSAAWAAANSEPLPPETGTPIGGEQMPLPMQRLVSLCYQLQIAQGTEPFFLSCRDAGKLLGIPYTTAFHWLEILTNTQGGRPILQKVATGSLATRRANEYRYIFSASDSKC